MFLEHYRSALADFPALFKLVRYYCNFWIWIPILFFLNIVIFFYISRYLKKKNFDKPDINYSKYRLPHKDFILLSALTIVFMIWKTTLLGKESFDTMETVNIIAIAEQLQTRFFMSLENMIVNAHQPLYPLILNIAVNLMDPKYYYFYLRFISAFFGMLTAYLAYYFSFRIFRSKCISYIAFVLLNVHGLFSFYSRRVEVYTIFCFLALLSYYYFWKTFISGEERKIWKYCLVNIICFFLHYLTLITIFSQVLTIFLLKCKNYRCISSFRFVSFIKSVIIFNFVIIVWSPAIYLSLFNNSFIFPDSWESSCYLGKEYLIPIINNILKLIMGFPLANMSIFLLIPLIIIFFKLEKEYPSFFVLLVSVAFSGLLFEAVGFLSMWRSIGRFYFNVRHFIWLVPFVVIMYSYGIRLLNRKIRLYKKIIGYISFSLIFIWNFYLTNKILVSYLTPSYREALHYIKNKFDDRDTVVWPIRWFDCSIRFPGRRIFGSQLNSFSEMRPKNFMRKKLLHERIWVIVPWEDYFGVPHISPAFLNEYINYLKQSLCLNSIWKGNKIDVYLFSTEKK